MRTVKHISTMLIMLLAVSITAQQGINYKAVVKDASGNLVANQSITIQFTIYKGDDFSKIRLKETHNPITDAMGIVIVNIGEGSIISGSLDNVEWEVEPQYLNVQIDTGGGLTDMGTTLFKTVPQAKFADIAGNVVSETIKINDLTDGKSDDDGTDNGSSVFLGIDAGLNDDGSHNRSVGVGFEALYSNTTWYQNTAVGYLSLRNNTLGNNNTAHGAYALSNNTEGYRNTAGGAWALYNNLTGIDNVAYGYRALHTNTETSGLTAIGYEALFNNTIGTENTAVGYKTLFANIDGDKNIALGYQALFSNTEGNNNTANGYQALFTNIDGDKNIALGYQALFSNTEGNNNTANGYQALFTNIDGDGNTAIGCQALFSNEGDEVEGFRGRFNTANGFQALYSNTTGLKNTATGVTALYFNTTGGNNTAYGTGALYDNSTGWGNTAIGNQALSSNSTGQNNVAIGSGAQVPDGTADNQVRIGNTSITYAGVQVAWDVTSDKRWKEKVRELPYGLEVLKQLKPVDYVRKNNEHKTREMGFIAQDVEALLTKIGYTDQGFLHKDDKGLMSLRYNDFIALLTKAIQEQQEIIEEQATEIRTLKKEQSNGYEKLLKRVEQLELVSNQ